MPDSPKSLANTLKSRLAQFESRSMSGNDAALEHDVKNVLLTYRSASSDRLVQIKQALVNCPCLRLAMEDWPWATALVSEQKQTSEVTASSTDKKEQANMAPKLRSQIDPLGRGRSSTKLDESGFDPGNAQSILERRAPTTPAGEEDVPGSSMSNPMVLEPSAVEEFSEPSGPSGDSSGEYGGGDEGGEGGEYGDEPGMGGGCSCGESPDNPMDVELEPEGEEGFEEGGDEGAGAVEEEVEEVVEDEPPTRGKRGCGGAPVPGDEPVSGKGRTKRYDPSEDPSEESNGKGGVMELHRGTQGSRTQIASEEIVDVDPRAVIAVEEEEEEVEDVGEDVEDAGEGADVEDVTDMDGVEELGDECPAECLPKTMVLEQLAPILDQVAPGEDLTLSAEPGEEDLGDVDSSKVANMVAGKSEVHEFLLDPGMIKDASASDIDFLLYGENSENPHYVVLVNGDPIAKIALSDQTLPVEHRDMFLDDSYPTFVREGIDNYGLPETLKSVNARYYTAKAFTGDVAKKMQAKAASEMAVERRLAAAKVKDDLINVAAIVLEGSMKNYILNNPLRDVLVADMRKAGVHPEVAVDVVEHAWREAAVNYFTSIIQKSEEWMGAPKEVLSHHVKEITGMDYRHPGYKRADSADEIPEAVETQVQGEPETLDPYLSTASVPANVPIRTSSAHAQTPNGDFKANKDYWKQQMNLVERGVFQRKR